MINRQIVLLVLLGATIAVVALLLANRLATISSEAASSVGVPGGVVATLAGAIFLLSQATIVASIARMWRPDRSGWLSRTNRTLEITWAVIPALAGVGAVVYGFLAAK